MVHAGSGHRGVGCGRPFIGWGGAAFMRNRGRQETHLLGAPLGGELPAFRVTSLALGGAQACALVNRGKVNCWRDPSTGGGDIVFGVSGATAVGRRARLLCGDFRRQGHLLGHRPG